MDEMFVVVLRKTLKLAHEFLELAILATPTGDKRNKLTEWNIAILKMVADLYEEKW